MDKYLDVYKRYVDNLLVDEGNKFNTLLKKSKENLNVTISNIFGSGCLNIPIITIDLSCLSVNDFIELKNAIDIYKSRLIMKDIYYCFINRYSSLSNLVGNISSNQLVEKYSSLTINLNDIYLDLDEYSKEKIVPMFVEFDSNDNIIRYYNLVGNKKIYCNKKESFSHYQHSYINELNKIILPGINEVDKIKIFLKQCEAYKNNNEIVKIKKKAKKYN